MHRAGLHVGPLLWGDQKMRTVAEHAESAGRTGGAGGREWGRARSTLLRLMLGELKPGAGLVTRHPQAKVGVFAQNNVEALVGRPRAGSSALAHLKELHPDGAGLDGVHASLAHGMECPDAHSQRDAALQPRSRSCAGTWAASASRAAWPRSACPRCRAARPCAWASRSPRSPAPSSSCWWAMLLY